MVYHLKILSATLIGGVMAVIFFKQAHAQQPKMQAQESLAPVAINQIGVSIPVLKKQVYIYATEIIAPRNTEVSLAIKVNHFESSSSEFSIFWDPNIVTFMNVERFGLLEQVAFDISQAKAGILRFSWKDPSGQVQALPDGSILFAICFKLERASRQSSTLSLSGQSLPIGRITVGEENPPGLEGLAQGFAVDSASPNPFTKEVTIGYHIPQDGRVTIQISDINGRVLKNWSENKNKGYQEMVWDGNDSSGNEQGAGLYFCSLQYKGRMETKKIMKAN